MSNRPPSSSGGRPRTGRPTTGRPMTSGGNGNGNQQIDGNHHQQAAYLDDWDEDEEDYESEDDGDVFAFVPPDLGPSPATLQNYDPAPYGHQTTQVNPTEYQQSQAIGVQDPNLQPQQPGLSEEEVYYFDETTGAVYDSQGRLVRGYNVSSNGEPILESGGNPIENQPQLRPMTGSTILQEAEGNEGNSSQPTSNSTGGIPLPSSSDPNDTINRGTSFDSNLPLGSRRANYLDPRISLDRKSSITSDNSTFKDNASLSGPVLSHSRSVGNGFPSMDALHETDRLPSSNSNNSTQQINNNRNIGLTAGGGIMVDNNIPSHVVVTPPNSSDGVNKSGRRGSTPKTPNSTHNRKGSRGNSQSNNNKDGKDMLPFAISLPKHPAEIRRRSNAGADYDVKTPSYEEEGMTVELRTSDDDDLMDAKHSQSYQLGGGDGLVHPVMQGVEVGSRGVRMVELEMEVEEDSPYPEVRASVSNIDDPDMPIVTLRMWFLALLFTTIAAGVNMFFVFRYPAPSISPTIVILLAWAGGKLMAAFLPYRTFYLPSWLGGMGFSLNPGIFNIKEHALITIMANVSISQAYAMNCIIVQDSDVYYSDARSAGFNIMFVISSQIIGFSLSGICRRFLVWPASMIWPQNLVVSTILNTLHAEEDGIDGRMTRYRFFYLVGIGAFVWYWIPGFLFTALSAFSWVCWIWPRSTVVNTLFGVTSGLGMSVLTFDWNQVIFIGSPLVVPWWAECNIFGGFVLFAWIISPAIYFTNTWYTGYFQINSSSSFDKNGDRYNFRQLLAPDGRSFDEQAYLNYSPLYLTATYTMTYFTGFAAATAVLVHTVLYHGKGLMKGIQNQRIEEDDVHAKRMRGYPEVPDWWYALTAIACLIMALITIEVWDTGLPIWGLILALMLPVLYILPSGFIFAMTGQQIGTNLTSETIAGYVLPGKAFPNMIFKVYALQGLLSGLNFVQDLKLGHYMKIPPRATFAVQIAGALWGAVVQVGVKTWMFGHIEGLCTPNQAHNFVCPHASVFYTSSIVWGVIGPEKLFGKGSLYHPLYWALLMGALIPFPTWLLSRRFPKSWFKFISWPLIFSGISYLTSGAGINYSCWFLAAFIFQFLLRKYNFRWWSKYNFVAAGALDTGTVVSSLVLFLVITLPMDGAIQLNWVGNTIYQNTLDYSGANNLPIPPGGIPDYRT